MIAESQNIAWGGTMRWRVALARGTALVLLPGGRVRCIGWRDWVFDMFPLN